MGVETILAVTAVAAAGISTYSAIQQAETQKEVGEYNNRNAELEARNQENLAAEAIRRERATNRRKVASMRANLANNGTLTSEGTPLALLGDTSANLELGIQDAARAASNQATSMRAQGAMSLWESRQQARAGYLNAAATAIKGISSGVSSYYSAVDSGLYSGTTRSATAAKSTSTASTV